MRRFKKFCISLLILSLIFLTGSQAAFAADEEYTYTVRLYAGNQGTLTNGGVEVSSTSANISSAGDCITVSGLKYGDTVYIRPQEAANVSDERYYVRGVRRSGRDNSEAEAPTFRVACDRDYVVAYGISGDLVAYTVNYQDMSGNTLRRSDTYYGNIGERQYVSSRYIEGYQPQTLNMVKTLSANSAENVFTFRYARIETPAQQTPAGGGTTPAGGGTTTPAGGGTTTAGGGTATGGAAAGGAAAGGAADANAPGDAGNEAVPDQDVPLGGDAGLEQVPDDNLPLDQQELEDLDDDEVPLAEIKEEQAGLMGYFPIYAGIGIAAAVALLVAGIYIYKKRKGAAAAADAVKKQDKNR